ncbi:MAG: mechanosensitive ion channel domain-containing protein [Myxococcota bacterium]|nr:mechanosensitive ion channel domain-containing protein [Myxococcota bacterium]
MIESIQLLWSYKLLRASAYLLLSIIFAWTFRQLLMNLITKWLTRTESALDDMIVARLKRPVYISILLIGVSTAVNELGLSPNIERRIDSVLESFAILLWAAAGSHISRQILTHLAHNDTNKSIVRPRTLPIFILFGQVFTWTFAAYLAFLAWSIDLTAWLASAGVLGIALGFAAKDSLANLFAGISILADSPYRVGDFISLDGQFRGRVTNIGVRSTRLLTTDEVEITIPNALLANARIVNESGGPGPMHRIRLGISVAYGSDPDTVRNLLKQCGEDVAGVSTRKSPHAVFRAFGASGLDFELLVWLSDPARLEQVTDEINTRIYHALNEAGIEIPFNKLDVYLQNQSSSNQETATTSHS